MQISHVYFNLETHVEFHDLSFNNLAMTLGLPDASIEYPIKHNKPE